MQKVIGQTGTMVLSDEKLQYKLSKGRTVRYQYDRMDTLQSCFMAWVCGPFHSALYGTCGFGVTKTSAKKALIRNLANNHNYIGRLMFSDVDESDTVGQVDVRLLDDNAIARPITNNELVGVSGR